MSVAGMVYQIENREYRKILEDIDYEGRLISIDLIDEVDDDYEEKVFNVARIIKSLEADILIIDNEEKRLRRMKNIVAENIQHLREYVQMSMLTLDKKVLENETLRINLRNNQPKLIVTSEVELIPEKYIIRNEVVKVDNKSIKDDLKEGVQMDFAYLQQDQSVVIR